VLYKFNNIGII